MNAKSCMLYLILLPFLGTTLKLQGRIETTRMTQLHGIHHIYIISVKGSIRTHGMESQMHANGLKEGADYSIVHPLNFQMGDYSIPQLISDGILSSPEKLDYHMKTDNQINNGTVSLSVMTYYLHLKAYLQNETILILEDNVQLPEKFVQKFNVLVDSLPTDQWDTIDFFSFKSKSEDECQDYWRRVLDKFKLEVDFLKKGQRPRLRNVAGISLGCNEGGGTKAYAIKGKSLMLEPQLPLRGPSDGIKNHITGWWHADKDGLGFTTVPNLVAINSFFESERRQIDAGSLPSNYTPLKEEEVHEIVTLIKQFKLSKTF